MDLKDKNIVLIGPSFFDYENQIKKTLESKGANVHFIDDRFNNDTLSKILIRLGFGNHLIKKKTQEYFKKELKKRNFETIDYFFVVNPEIFTGDLVKKYKEKFPNSKFILYMWDSFLNKKNAQKSLPYFDSIFTFDPEDATNYNLKYLPLFYIEDYQNIEPHDNYKYKVSFIGTAHSDRYFLVNKIIDQFQTNKFFTFFYFQSKILFYFNKLTNNKFKDVKMEDISYKPLDKNQVMEIINNSEIIIDIHHPKQMGMTMRMIEMIGAKKKLITTNQEVIKMDFYNPNNILIVDRDNPEISQNFIDSKYQNISNEIYTKYSISSWVDYIFNN